MAGTEETAVEEAAVLTEVLSLESFGRLKTPPTGEVELSVECKQNLLPNVDASTLASQKLDVDVSICAASMVAGCLRQKQHAYDIFP